MTVQEMTLGEWVDYGVGRGYCSEVVCDTHNGLPSTPEETEQWEAGGDPCVPAVRLYTEGGDMKKYGQGEVLAEDDEEQTKTAAASNWTEEDAKALEAENVEADNPQ